jgi:hypothetical protein
MTNDEPVGRRIEGDRLFEDVIRQPIGGDAGEERRIEGDAVDVNVVDGVHAQQQRDVVGAEAGSTAPTTVAAEWMRGSTAVGFPGGSFTMNFDTVYLLGSHKFGHERVSARIERFTTSDASNPAIDFARENGHAWTLAWFHEPNPRSRAGLEYCRASGDRPGLAPGFAPRTGGSTVTAEYRFSF